MTMHDVPPLPRLRDGLSLSPFASSTKETTYLLVLPDGRSLQASAPLCMLLLLLDGTRTVHEIARRVSQAWGRNFTRDDVERWIRSHVLPHALLAAPEGGEMPDRPGRPHRRRTSGIPLLPASLLRPLTYRLRSLFHPSCAAPLLWIALLCHVLFYVQLLGSSPEPGPAGLDSRLVVPGYLCLIGSVLFHELGHLSACSFLGCPHGEIRFGVYLVFPVFYANVTAAWRLRRRDRVIVDLGGMYFQLLLTIPAFAWYGATRDALAWFLFLELDGMILWCLNPFLRFDGYWICSDLLGVPNLRSRARRMLATLVLGLLGRPARKPSPLLDLRPAEGVGLLVYGILSQLFALVFVVFLARIFLATVRSLPPRILALLETIRRGVWPGMEVTGAVVIPALLLLFLSAAFLRTGARALRQAVQAIHRLRERRQHPRGGRDERG